VGAGVIKVTLPWPDKVLWPNGRTRSFHKRARLIALHRQWGKIAALGAGARNIAHGDERIPVHFLVHPMPRGPAPDRDACISACKSYLDGIADALGVNDSLFDPQPPVIGERGGTITITVGEAA